MSECSLDKKGHIALVTSVAANIFMVAFLLGKMGAGPEAPPQPSGPMGAMSPQAGPGFVPPPAFGPGDLFKPEDLQADEIRLQSKFEKMDALRKDFAKQLESSAITKEQALKHFADINQIMDGVKKEAQERMADKIASMSETERKNFAQTLINRKGGLMGGGPRGIMPRRFDPPMRPGPQPHSEDR